MMTRTRTRKCITLLLLVVTILTIVVVWNDQNQVSRQITVTPAREISVDEDAVIERLRGAIALPTVSASNPARSDSETMLQFADYLNGVFPAVHAEPMSWMTRQDFGDPDNLTILYRWPGSDNELEPILFMAHFDVVPVEPATKPRWTHAPFSGELDQGFIWGRGTLDAKNSLMAMMEAVRHLRDDGLTPRRTVFFSFGHDEEVGGRDGNAQVARWMKSQGIRLKFVVDEGGCILRDFPGMQENVALIGIAEKGFANFQLTVVLADGGHASMPPRQTAIEIIAAAIDRVARTPLPRRLTGASDLMMDYLGPEMPWPGRVAIANRWLLEPVILRGLGATPSGDAMLRTTFAPTLIRAGVKENVLPSRATATINVRLLPGDTVAEVKEHLAQAINDERVAIEVGPNAREASRISRTDSEGSQCCIGLSKKSIPGRSSPPSCWWAEPIRHTFKTSQETFTDSSLHG